MNNFFSGFDISVPNILHPVRWTGPTDSPVIALAMRAK